ncbi:hypothetical protein L211DRAFT_340197 [Terfezia boudieri ATCC MYA-4762]|uniref:Uncharacterized protein n=1 Tax=Terfezia boudieri ATCC MYA-4762 TaxID=1051890 RepID=A0A3N4LH42_9PEZI|nr:hypothetical protein L211DRAFT_340197 [Terfezia boudieri ATCC MYA-4762]
MEDIVHSGEPQTPYLHPQDLPEEEEQVPDFFLDDDADVGSPMDFSDEESNPSLSTILALGALSPCPSPAPSLVSDASLLSEVSVMSDSECSDGTFKMKKLVRFLDSVEIVPYDRKEPKSTGPLKPPQEPPQYVMRKFHGNAHGDYSRPEDIAILHGLGRAGSPRSSSLLHLQQREFNTHRPTSPLTDISESETEDEDTQFGPPLKQYRRQQLLTVPIFPPSSWRTNPEKMPYHDGPPRVKSPGEMDGYAGQDYKNSYPFHHPQPQRHTEAIRAYSYWRDGEIRYEDQWGRRIYPKGNWDSKEGAKNKQEEGFRFDLWPPKEDVMGETGMGGGKVVVPGGNITLREQRLRARGIRRR